MNTNVKQMMENIGSYVIDTINNHDLKEVYKGNFKLPDEELFSDDERERIKNKTGNSEKEISLKKLLNEKLKQTDKKFEYYNWIVTKWGGITRFTRKQEEIETFLQNIENGILTKEQFEIISSYSKIASFSKLNKFFVYDSRVAYVLNWFLLKNANKETTYFPLPTGRNNDFVNYNMNTVLYLYYKDVPKYYDIDNKNNKCAYFVYCEFIKEIFKNINREKIKEPFYIEMILFGLFEAVVKQVKKHISISIKN